MQTDWMAGGMVETGKQAHWQAVYGTKPEAEVSWFQDVPTPSLALIDRCGLAPDAAVLDVGGGASRLVDALLAQGRRNVSVLDLSAVALDTAKARLGAVAATVDWIAADVTSWTPPRRYDLWHDRAAFHFLTGSDDRAAYAACVTAAVAPGGWVIIGTFAPDGPERCSGLPVMRQDARTVGACLGPQFALVETLDHSHRTPGGTEQRFQFGRFRKAG